MNLSVAKKPPGTKAAPGVARAPLQQGSTSVADGGRKPARDLFEQAAIASKAALLGALPKADLHCHLDGSLRLSTIFELADAQGVRLPAESPEALARSLKLGERVGSLVEYLKAFDVTLSVLQRPEALSRAAYELGADCAAENVRYLEVRYSPVLHTREGLAPEAIVEAVLDGLSRAQRDHGIRSNLLVCGMRHLPAEVSRQMAALAARYKARGVVGFDLAGPEAEFPPELHRAAFDHARAAGLHVTVHAGEAAGAASIGRAIDDCGAERIGHGVRLGEDPAVLQLVKDRQIPLEMCPTSNIQTGACADFAAHPLAPFHRMGLRVTINTDNRMVSATNSTNELLVAHQQLGMSLDELVQVVDKGFQSAFLPPAEKDALVKASRKQVAQAIAAFEAQVARGP